MSPYQNNCSDKSQCGFCLRSRHGRLERILSRFIISEETNVGLRTEIETVKVVLQCPLSPLP